MTIASASIASPSKNNCGKCISGSPLMVIFASIIPAIISNSTSGIRIFLPTQEHIIPMNSRTAIDVVISNASCMHYCAVSFFINFYYY